MASPSLIAAAGGSRSAFSSPTINGTVTYGATVTAGQLLLAQYFVNNAGVDWTWPAGWTSLDNGTTSNLRMNIRYRIADGSEGTTLNCTTPGHTEGAAWCVWQISGWSGTPEVGTAVVGNSKFPDPPNLAPSWGLKDVLWVPCASHTGNWAFTGYPSGYSNGGNWNNSGGGVGIAGKASTASSEDPGAFTMSGGGPWRVNTVAIKGEAPALSTRTYGPRQAINRAASWMKRHDGLFVPERKLRTGWSL